MVAESSSEEAKLREIDHLKKVLSVSGYTKSAWVTATKPKAPTVPQDPSTTRYRGSITLPYVGHLTDAICRTIRKAGVSVHLKSYNTIWSRLVHPKDKVPKDERAGVVHQIQCSDCDAAYVVETERSLRKRVSEHHRSSSPVGHHLNQRRHSFSEKEVSILHQETDWFAQGGSGSHPHHQGEPHPEPRMGKAHPPGRLPGDHPVTWPDSNIRVTWRRNIAVAISWRRRSDGRRKLLPFSFCCEKRLALIS